MRRRTFVAGASAAMALAARRPAAAASAPDETTDLAFFDDLQRRTFRYFWDTTNPANGLAPDRWPGAPFSSIAAVGFALTAYPIGIERGWVPRSAARDRVLTTLRFFHRASGGSLGAGAAGYKGFFYHFLDMSSGARFETIELSTIDTALLLAGVLFCQSFFLGDDAAEAEIRTLAEEIYRRVDWQWATAAPHAPAITLGWTPESGFHPQSWHTYNEAAIIYILALGSPTFPVEPAAWLAWQNGFDDTWGLNHGPLPHVGYPSLFVHQYPHVWIDFRGIRDGYMRGRDLDYFENSRRATYAQRAWAIENPHRWKDYGPDTWGLTACDGPGPLRHYYGGQSRWFNGYTARGPGRNDDGTIAPTAVLGSMPFAPELCAPGALALNRDHGDLILGRYGFFDAFNPSFDFDDLAPRIGRRAAGKGWAATQYLGIDQGPIVAMLENWRSGMIWRVMRTNPHIMRGLRRAGFSGGWVDAA